MLVLEHDRDLRLRIDRVIRITHQVVAATIDALAITNGANAKIRARLAAEREDGPTPMSSLEFER